MNKQRSKYPRNKNNNNKLFKYLPVFQNSINYFYNLIKRGKI